MHFDSVTYLLFLPLVWLCWRFAPRPARWAVLLVASYVFYAWLGAAYLPVALALVTLGAYAVGRLLPRARPGSGARSALFWGGAGWCLAFLVLLRYLPGAFGELFPWWAPRSGAVLVAAGVSFYVFQAVAYLADVHLGILAPERHLGVFAVYLSFFPKLLQGPIERGGALLPQLRAADATFRYDDVRHGAVLFAWGLFKKIVIANRLALLANAVYDHPRDHTGVALLVGTYAYAFQLYFDFSGYTDMALGAGRLFGLRLTPNFDGPYLATSMADFWRRWHMSFSRWLQDYLFKPLQMAVRGWGTAGTVLCVLATFVVCGVWHGGAWHYAAWGALHGLFLGAGVLTARWQKNLFRKWRLTGTRTLAVARVLITFHLVCLAWVFFRAASLGDAWYILTHAVRSFRGVGNVLGSLGQSDAITLGLGLAATAIAGHQRAHGRGLSRFFALPLPVRWVCYYALAAALLFLGSDAAAPFVYERF